MRTVKYVGKSDLKILITKKCEETCRRIFIDLIDLACCVDSLVTDLILIFQRQSEVQPKFNRLFFI